MPTRKILKLSREPMAIAGLQMANALFMIFWSIDMEDVSDATDYNIIGALILSRLGRFPETGEKITWNDFTLEVVDMDGVRIDKVLVTRNIAD